MDMIEMVNKVEDVEIYYILIPRTYNIGERVVLI